MLFSSAPAGVLVLDKAKGLTSHDVVSHMRRVFGIRSIGHAGTLDPMATGVLVLAIGEATKLVPWLTVHDKAYDASIALGVATDTLDAEGREIHRETLGSELRAALSDPHDPALGARLHAALEHERRRTSQVPPQYSAIKVLGQRAFARARRGQPTELAARSVRVDRIDLVGCVVEPARVDLTLEVGSGYYVRAMARDLAETLGTCGHLTRLRRTRSGPFRLAEALPIDAPGDVLRAHVQPLADVAARTLSVARLTPAGARDARCGRIVQHSDIAATAEGPCAWLDEHGTLVAVGAVGTDGRGSVIRGFSGN
jgi:tRNA pseudouridine55 synthase